MKDKYTVEINAHGAWCVWDVTVGKYPKWVESCTDKPSADRRRAFLNADYRKENPMTKQELLDQIQGAEKAANAATAEVEELRRQLKVVEDDEKAIVWKDDGRGEYFKKDGWQVCILSGQSPFGKTSEIYNFLAVQNQSGLRFSGSGYADHAVRRFAEDWFNNGCKCQ